MHFIWLLFLVLPACQNFNKSQERSVAGSKSPYAAFEGDFTTNPGWVSVFQTFTSSTETSINILRPRLTDIEYYFQENTGEVKDIDYKKLAPLKIVKTTSGPHIHWKVDRVFIEKLDPKKTYRLLVVNKRGYKTIDWRVFKTLETGKSQARFIVGSCMSDSHAFEHARAKIWDQMLTHNAEFLILLGDQVYVDDFDFVKRNEVSEFDIWTRYIDSFRKIPLFQNRQLIPIFSTWDDHDYGTNNADKTFKSKAAAKMIYTAFFGGEPIKDVVSLSQEGVYLSFNGFNQKFVFMDDRYFREPSSANPYGQWGKQQHQWFANQLKTATTPVWIANGGQFFTNATFVKKEDGTQKQINETFIKDHPAHFNQLLTDIKQAAYPVLFLSGDIHYSEIAEIEKPMLGYTTYEITSSPVHSYIYRDEKGQDTFLDNPRRIVAAKEYNYLVVDSSANGKNLKINVSSFGLKQSEPYFDKKLEVVR